SNTPVLNRQFLSVSQIIDQYGPSQDAYDQVVSYLQSYGFSISEQSPNRLTIAAAGTRGQAERAFNLTNADYQIGDRVFYANTSNPRVPNAIGPSIQAVMGLSNLARPLPAQPTQPIARPGEEVLTQSLTAPIGSPMALATAYDFQGVTGATGSGQK